MALQNKGMVVSAISMGTLLAIIGIYLTYVYARKDAQSYHTQLSNYFTGYGFEKSPSASFSVDRVMVRKNPLMKYQLKRVIPGMDFQGLTELHISSNDLDMDRDTWKGTIEHINRQLAFGLPDNARLHLNSGASPEVRFKHMRGSSNETAVLVIDSVDPDVIEYILNFQVAPYATRSWDESQRRQDTGMSDKKHANVLTEGAVKDVAAAN